SLRNCLASSNIAENLADYRLDHDGTLMARVLDRVVELENEGYQFEAAEASFILLVERLPRRVRARVQRRAARRRFPARVRPAGLPCERRECPGRPPRHRGDRQGPRRRRGRAYR